MICDPFWENLIHQVGFDLHSDEFGRRKSVNACKYHAGDRMGEHIAVYRAF